MEIRTKSKWFIVFFAVALALILLPLGETGAVVVIVPEKASIGDYVWHDENQDGIQDLNEAGIEGVKVELLGCDSDSVFATTYTDIHGYYIFSDLDEGSYKVKFHLPNENWFFSSKNADTNGIEGENNSDADPTTGITDCVTVVAGENKLFVDAGMYLKEINLVEKLTVSKTAVTSYSRNHNWTINKWVQTEKGLTTGEHNVPKIWLYPDNSGDETASWYVDVNYSGFVDSSHTVSGTITIINTGDLDAVIEAVKDLMGSTSVSVELNVELPYTLAVNETLIGTYSVTGFNQGSNEVTVTTERDSYYDSAELIWGEPESEYNHTVSIKDVSDIFGENLLGVVTAPNDKTFTYSKLFSWNDYTSPGPYTYNNVASIIETGQEADAKLVVNWEPDEQLCYGDETAWAYGGKYAEPNWNFVNNRFWGWTNGPLSKGAYEFELWAGAGLNNLSKGELVGKVTVDYSGSTVKVIYQTYPGYYLGETHLWVGDKPLPEVKRGKKIVYTNAPGQFPYGSTFSFKPAESGNTTEWIWEESGFKKDIYIAAHAVVYVPVNCR